MSSDPGIRLVPLRPEDETELIGLFQRNAVPEVTAFFDPFPLDGESARRISHHEGRDRFWGVWRDHELVAFAMVRGWDGGHPEPAVGLFVDRAHAGQGIGRATLGAVLAAMRGEQVSLLRARVHEPNVASRRAFRSVGFEEIGREPGRVILEWTA